MVTTGQEFRWMFRRIRPFRWNKNATRKDQWNVWKRREQRAIGKKKFIRANVDDGQRPFDLCVKRTADKCRRGTHTIAFNCPLGSGKFTFIIDVAVNISCFGSVDRLFKQRKMVKILTTEKKRNSHKHTDTSMHGQRHADADIDEANVDVRCIVASETCCVRNEESVDKMTTKNKTNDHTFSFNVMHPNICSFVRFFFFVVVVFVHFSGFSFSTSKRTKRTKIDRQNIQHTSIMYCMCGCLFLVTIFSLFQLLYFLCATNDASLCNGWTKQKQPKCMDADGNASKRAHIFTFFFRSSLYYILLLS